MEIIKNYRRIIVLRLLPTKKVNPKISYVGVAIDVLSSSVLVGVLHYFFIIGETRHLIVHINNYQ